MFRRLWSEGRRLLPRYSHTQDREWGVVLRSRGGMVAWMRLCLALSWFGFGGVMHAELQWLARRILLEPPAGAVEAFGEFEFINRGTTPIKVVEARSDCGCTVMAPEKSEVLPGEKGKIRAVYHIGSRQGKQSVAVTVTTSEPEAHSYELTVETEIKDFVTLTPRLIFWKVGDDPAAKIFQLTLLSNYRFLGAESSTTDFLVEVVGQADGMVQLRVTPRNTWAKRNGIVKLNVVQHPQAPVEVQAYVRVL